MAVLREEFRNEFNPLAATNSEVPPWGWWGRDGSVC